MGGQQGNRILPRGGSCSSQARNSPPFRIPPHSSLPCPFLTFRDSSWFNETWLLRIKDDTSDNWRLKVTGLNGDGGRVLNHLFTPPSPAAPIVKALVSSQAGLGVDSLNLFPFPRDSRIWEAGGCHGVWRERSD